MGNGLIVHLSASVSVDRIFLAIAAWLAQYSNCLPYVLLSNKR